MIVIASIKHIAIIMINCPCLSNFINSPFYRSILKTITITCEGDTRANHPIIHLGIATKMAELKVKHLLSAFSGKRRKDLINPAVLN